MAPALNFPPALLLKAHGIRAAIFDVDGVLTDGQLYIGAEGETLKAFSSLDGHGLKLLQQGGIEPIVITGRDSAAVRRRLADLGLTHCAFGVSDKLAVAEALLANLGLGWNAIAAMGDDWPDLPLLTRAAFARAALRHLQRKHDHDGHGREVGRSQLEAAAQVDDGHHRATQVQDAQDVWWGLRDAGDRGPAPDFLHPQYVQAICLVAEPEGQILRGGSASAGFVGRIQETTTR